MNDQTPITREHNQPPELLPVEDIIRQVKEERHEELDRLRQAQVAAERAPAEIADDETLLKFNDFYKMCRNAVGMADAARKLEIEPFDTRKKAIDAVFKVPIDAVKKLMKEKLSPALDKYNAAKAEEARLAAEAKAKAEREESERLQREAAAAEAARVEAERKRREAEERAAAAQKAREEAEERARLQKIAAEEAKQREAALQKQIEEDRIREEEDRQRREREAELARQLKEEQDAEAEAREAEAEKQRQAERERKDRELAAAKAAREAAEEETRKAREESKAALESRRAAEDEGKAAGQEMRTAARTEKTAMSAAVRSEKIADKADRVAHGSASDLTRSRSELGSVGTMTTRWVHRVVDRTKIPPEKVFPFITAEELHVLVGRYMKSVPVEARVGALPGAVFEQIEESRVL